jgi:hypothetical protein
MKPRKPYPSDISREQFESVRPLLESVRKRTKPRTVDQYEVFNAVLQTVDRRTVLRMAGKMPAPLEELRTQTEYKPADNPPRLLRLLLRRS